MRQVNKTLSAARGRGLAGEGTNLPGGGCENASHMGKSATGSGSGVSVRYEDPGGREGSAEIRDLPGDRGS